MIVATVCGVVILGPLLLGRGFLLRYDLVFTPHLPLSATTLGTAGQVPRAVPNDAIVALIDLVLPGDVTQKLVLLGAFVVIGLGVDRWRAPGVARFGAAALLCWNPWVAERLSIGHWGYLWGYAALVWAVVGALAARARSTSAAHGRHARASIAVALLVSAASGSTGAVLVLVALACIGLAPGHARASTRAVIQGGVAWVALNASWWFAFLALAPSNAADSEGVRAFSSASDGAGGVVLSVLGGGGIWHAPSWPSERASWLVAIVSAALLVAGFVVAARRFGGWPIALVTAAGLVLALAGAAPGVRAVVSAVVLDVPGGGLLRDGQKFTALWVVPAALGVSMGLEGIRRIARGTLLAPVAIAAGLVVPIALLPSLAWAHGGRWQLATYPASWTRSSAVLDERGGTTLVLPWSTYRRYGWNGDTVVLDPWNRLVRDDVLSDDSLTLTRGGHQRTVAGENVDGARVARAVATGSHDALAAAMWEGHVRSVVVQTDQPDAAAQGALVRAAGARLLRQDSAGHLDVYAVGGDTQTRDAEPVWRSAGLVVSLLAFGLVVTDLAQHRRVRRPAARRCQQR